MRISDWSSDVCSSDLQRGQRQVARILDVGIAHALEQDQVEDRDRGAIERYPAIAPDHRHPIDLGAPVEPITGKAGDVLAAAPHRHERHRQREYQALRERAEPGFDSRMRSDAATSEL